MLSVLWLKMITHKYLWQINSVKDMGQAKKGLQSMASSKSFAKVSTKI